MIYAWCKLFNVTPDYVLYNISYQNLILYGAATPSYDHLKDKPTEKWDDSIDANNPNNFNDQLDDEEIRV